MKRFALCFLLLSPLLFASDAAAQKKQQKSPCEEIATQFEANQCAHREYLAADAELNKVYKQLWAKLDEEERAVLRNAETAWLKYRDSNCEYESSFYRGGSMRPAIQSLCLARMTEARTAELKQQMKDYEECCGSPD